MNLSAQSCVVLSAVQRCELRGLSGLGNRVKGVHAVAPIWLKRQKQSVKRAGRYPGYAVDTWFAVKNGIG